MDILEKSFIKSLGHNLQKKCNLNKAVKKYNITFLTETWD